MLKMFYISIIVAAVITLAFLVVKVHRFGFSVLWEYIKTTARRIISASGFVFAAIAALIACYSNICEVLRETLSAEAMSEIKLFLQLITGADSAFVALQTAAFTSLMIGLVTSFALLSSWLILYARFTACKATISTTTEEESVTVQYEHVAPKCFLLYSRYNS